MATSMLAGMFASSKNDGDRDLEDLAAIKRAPPMPMESVRRVVAAVLHATKMDELKKVEDHLSRQGNGMSLYSGRSSYFDILMAVFPMGKPLKTSRAAFAGQSSAIKAALLLSWAATCERWAAEYEHTRKLIDSPDRASPYAVLRATQFATETAKADMYGGTGKIDFAGSWKEWITEAAKAVPVDDPLVTLTRQILWFRPLIWHRELQPSAVLEDPVIFDTVIDSDTKPYVELFTKVIASCDDPTIKDKTKTAFADVINEVTDAGKSKTITNINSTVVYVDGASLVAATVFKKAIEQLVEETKAMYPSNKPKFRRGGVCPAGESYTVLMGGAPIPRGPLDAAVRAVLRKYGPIDKVTVECTSSSANAFLVVPIDGSAVW